MNDLEKRTFRQLGSTVQDKRPDAYRRGSRQSCIGEEWTTLRNLFTTSTVQYFFRKFETEGQISPSSRCGSTQVRTCAFWWTVIAEKKFPESVRLVRCEKNKQEPNSTKKFIAPLYLLLLFSRRDIFNDDINAGAL